MRNVTACAIVDIDEGRTPRLYHRPDQGALAEAVIYNELTTANSTHQGAKNEQPEPTPISSHRRRNHRGDH